MMEPAFLGTVTAPSGVLALLDMGLLGAWHVDPDAHRAALGAAVARGPGPFVVAGLHGVAIPGLPRDRALRVLGTRLEGGELAGLWQAVFVEVAPGLEPARSVEIGAVVIDTERVLVADADALGAWVHDEPVDGLADFVFWGDGAAATAKATSAADLGEGTFGWVDLPHDEAMERGMDVEDHCDDHELAVETDFRPHSHHHAMLSQMRESPVEAGKLELGGASLVAFFTMWQPGAFPVVLDLDADGHPVRVGVWFATKQAILARHAQRHAPSEFE